jgi:hypothetical protein
MSATSGICRGIAGRCSEGALKLGGADSPTVELIQSLSDMPARRAAASALSRTEGSMPSTLHDTREFMLSSGSASAPHLRHQPPRASHRRDNRIFAQVACLGTDFFALR